MIRADRRQIRAGRARALVFGAALLFASAPAQGQDGVCVSPTRYCAQSLDAVCLSRFGAGVEPREDGQEELSPQQRVTQAQACRAELDLYKDCLSLVAAQCPAAIAGAPALAPAEPGAVKPDPLKVWAEIKGAKAPEVFDAFAKDYPGSPLAALATAKAAELRGGVERPAEPDAPKLAPPASEKAAEDEARRQSAHLARQFREAQGHLTRIGYDAGPADGIWGARSATALSQFLRDNGRPASTLLTPEALGLLRSAPDGSAPRRAPVAATPPPAPSLSPSPSPSAREAARPPAAPTATQLTAVIAVEFRFNSGRRQRCETRVPTPSRALSLPKLAIDCGRGATLRLETRADGVSRIAVAHYGADEVRLSGTSWRYSGRTRYKGRGDVSSAVVTVDFIER